MMERHHKLRQALERLGWTRAILADQIGAGRSTVKGWTAGRYAPPDEVMAWLDSLAAHHASHPPPPIRRPGRPPKTQENHPKTLSNF